MWQGGGGGGGGGNLLDGMVQERMSPNMDVQHLRKRGYPDDVERGAL